MPIENLANFRARLSYDEIGRYTGWKSNVMINDYLGISGATQVLVDQINTNEANITINAQAIAFNFQYLHGVGSYSPDYDESGTSYVIGDLVSESGNEYAAKIDIPSPADAFNPLNWDRVSTTDNYVYLKVHESETVAHGSTGDIVGNEDFCTELVGGVVLLMELVNDAVDSFATVATPDVGAAPAAYDQAYADQQTDLINEVKSAHNTLVTDLNSAIAQLNDLIAKSKTANQMDT